MRSVVKLVLVLSAYAASVGMLIWMLVTEGSSWDDVRTGLCAVLVTMLLVLLYTWEDE